MPTSNPIAPLSKPTKVLYTYFELYNPGTLSGITALYNQLNIFQTVIDQAAPSSGAMQISNNTSANASRQMVQDKRDAGVRIVLTIGGQNAGGSIIDQAGATRAAKDFINIVVNNWGIIDGMDWNNFEAGITQDPAWMAYSTRLVANYFSGTHLATGNDVTTGAPHAFPGRDLGQNFYVGSAPAPYLYGGLDGRIAVALQNEMGTARSYTGPQSYDGPGSDDPVSCQGNLDGWVSIGIAKANVAWGTHPTAVSYSFSPQQLGTFYKANPSLAGCYNFSYAYAGNLAWAQYLNPIVLAGAPPSGGGGAVITGNSDWHSPTVATFEVGWANPNNVFTHDGANATVTITNAETPYTRVSGFNFVVPSNATIVGAEIRAFGSTSAALDYSYFFLGQVITGTPQTLAANQQVVLPLTTPSFVGVGGPSDLWGGVGGGTWNPAFVNDANFGISGAWHAVGTATISIDQLQAKIYYTTPAPPPPPPAVSATTVGAALLTKTTFVIGDTLSVGVTFTTTGAASTAPGIAIALRPPGGTHAGGPFLDVFTQANGTLPLGSRTVSGSRTFTAADPLGTYEVYGTYSDAGGTYHDGTSSFVTLAAYPPPVANFDFAPNNGTAPQAVTFTDTSVGNPTTWSWVFTAGGVTPTGGATPTSVLQNPSYTYPVASPTGGFQVTLTAANSYGTSSVTKYVTVGAIAPTPTPAPVILPPDPVSSGPKAADRVVGNTLVIGSEAMVVLQWSNDGQNWSDEMWLPAGRIGEFAKRVKAYRLGSARSRVFRVRCYDPLPWRLNGAYLDLATGVY
jgi:PKD repeat protein